MHDKTSVLEWKRISLREVINIMEKKSVTDLRLPYNVSRKEIKDFVKANTSVEKWLRKYLNSTKYEYSQSLARYFKWLRIVKGIKLLPKEMLNDHLKCRKSEDVTIRKKHLNLALEFTRDNPDFQNHSDARKKLLFAAIRSFYSEYEVPLTTVKGVFGKVRTKYKRKQMTLDEAKKIIGASPQREKTILIIMLQSGMSIGDVLFKFTYKWKDIKPQLNKPRIRIEMEGRKGNVEPYFTYISRDAIQELKKYIAKRGEPKEGEAIFITSTGRALMRMEVYNVLRPIYRKAGIDKEYRSHTTHMLRKLFKTESRPPERGIDQDIIEFMMGHKAGLDAVGGVYDRTPELYAEVIEGEYEKLEPYLNIFSQEKTQIELQKRKQTIEDLARMLPDMTREKLETLKQILAHAETEEEMERGFEEWRSRTKLEPIRRESGYATEEEDCQKIIDESELPEYLKKQWHVVCTLPSGKIVVSNE